MLAVSARGTEINLIKQRTVEGGSLFVVGTDSCPAVPKQD